MAWFHAAKFDYLHGVSKIYLGEIFIFRLHQGDTQTTSLHLEIGVGPYLQANIIVNKLAFHIINYFKGLDSSCLEATKDFWVVLQPCFCGQAGLLNLPRDFQWGKRVNFRL